jgi:hypothetical protein
LTLQSCKKIHVLKIKLAELFRNFFSMVSLLRTVQRAQDWARKRFQRILLTLPEKLERMAWN